LLGHAAPRPCCLIAGDGNDVAHRVYRAAGFVETARRPAVGDALWSPPYRHWVLMRKA
jgi:hypothetical protein